MNKILLRKYCKRSCGLSLQEEVAEWEAKANTESLLEKITINNLNVLVNLLSSENDKDSYLASAVYYAFTGRNGLWVFREGNSFVLLCWHPNIIGQMLIFPQRGEKSTKIITNLLSRIPKPPVGLSIARAKKGSSEVLLKEAEEKLSDMGIHCAIVPERVLDWAYPVHVLSTEKVMRMEGPDFRGIRNHVRVAERQGITVERPTYDRKDELKMFVQSWAKRRSEDARTMNSLLSPYFHLLDLWESKKLTLDGMVFVIDRRIRAATFWDISNAKFRTANRFVNLCNPRIHGLADFVTHHTATSLFKKGIHFFNIGGSETASLDQFKRKFMPAYSVPLETVDVSLGEKIEHSLAQKDYTPARNVGNRKKMAA